MIISNVVGNLIDDFLNPDCKTITDMAHGCNCFNRMGAGIALEVKNRIPKAYEVDQRSQRGDPYKLGGFTYANIEEAVRKDRDHRYNAIRSYGGNIYNLYTQWDTNGRGRGEPDVNYEAIHKAFTAMDHMFLSNPNMILGIPLIGCGLAGGDWNFVKAYIDSCTPNLPVVVYHFKGASKE